MCFPIDPYQCTQILQSLVSSHCQPYISDNLEERTNNVKSYNHPRRYYHYILYLNYLDYCDSSNARSTVQVDYYCDIILSARPLQVAILAGVLPLYKSCKHRMAKGSRVWSLLDGKLSAGEIGPHIGDVQASAPQSKLCLFPKTHSR